MTYTEIFILGWNLNALMFVVNLVLALLTMKPVNPEDMAQKSQALHELKQEFDAYYPNRKFETLFTYFVPFVAFYRVNFRIIEMILFFSKNRGTEMFDFMIYKYQQDIQKAKNNDH